jgi:GT2 family glycosyltransferase
MKVGAVVLHYRFWPRVRSTLEALLSQTRRPDEIVLVDNRSDDGSAESIRGAFPQVEVIEARLNRGYAAGMNIGLHAMLSRGAEAILLLTHECRLAPDALRALVARLEEEPILGAVGPLLAYESAPHLVFSAGGSLRPRDWRGVHLREPDRVDDWRGRDPHAVEWLDGAAILLRDAAARALGKLDEDYFMYYEETEYLVRLRAAGWKVECVPAAVAWQESGGKPDYLFTRNRLRFVARVAPRRVLLLELARELRSLIENSRRPRSTAEIAVDRERRRAVLHFLLRRWGPGPTDDAITGSTNQPESSRT